MKVRMPRKRVTVVVATAMALALGGGVAYAYWTSSGTGTGSALTGSSENFDVASTASVDPPLTPGGPEQIVAFTIHNPSAGVQHLTSVTVTVADTGGVAWTSGTVGPPCTAADYTVGTPAITTPATLPGDIDPDATIDGTVTIAMKNLGTNQDNCKDVTAPLWFVAA